MTIDPFFVAERRPIHGFMKVYEYEPPGCREEDDQEDEGEGYAFKHVAKESHVPNQTVSCFCYYSLLFIIYFFFFFFSDIP